MGTLGAVHDDDLTGPPHPEARTWRHPSELPPSDPANFGRTLAGLVAILGLVMSGALLSVVVPSGPLRPTSTTARSQEDQPAPPNDVREAALAYDERTGQPLAVLSRSGFLVGALDDVAVGDRLVVTDLTGRRLPSTVVEVDDGLTWLHTIEPSTGEFVPLDDGFAVSEPSPTDHSTGRRLWIVGRRDRFAVATVGVRGPTYARSDRVPLDPPSTHDVGDAEFDDVGAALDEAGRLLGICVRHRDVRLVVPLARLMADLQRLESGGRRG